MANVYFISDLHLAHKRILEFARQYRQGTTVEEHDNILIENLCKTLNKRSVLYILGDVCFGGEETLFRLKEVPGRKILVRGNHDTLPIKSYLEVFEEVYGIVKYKGFWLSHAPVHPEELRGCRNIHGHVHHKSLRQAPAGGLYDSRYINVSVEALGGIPINLQDIRNGNYYKMRKC